MKYEAATFIFILILIFYSLFFIIPVCVYVYLSKHSLLHHAVVSLMLIHSLSSQLLTYAKVEGVNLLKNRWPPSISPERNREREDSLVFARWRKNGMIQWFNLNNQN